MDCYFFTEKLSVHLNYILKVLVCQFLGDHDDENEKSQNYDGVAAYIGEVVHEEGRGSLMGVHWSGRGW